MGIGPPPSLTCLADRFARLMSNRTRKDDHRREPRFDVVGHLTGSFALVETLRVRNLSSGGVLVETSRPLPQSSVHTLHFTPETGLAGIQARVVRVTPSEAGTGYTVALEFTNLVPSALAVIERILGANGGSLA